MKRLVVVIGVLAMALMAACAPAAIPTPDAMMAKASPTVDAMMAKASPTVDAMMAKASPTVDAMMAKASPTADAMMAKVTPTADAMMSSGSAMVKLPDQMSGMHFVGSLPKHGVALAKRPDQVQISFNAALSDMSTVTVTKDGVMLKTGMLLLDAKMLSMSVTLPSDAGNGVYLVKYKACWADKTCDDGQFGFQVDAKAGM